MAFGLAKTKLHHAYSDFFVKTVNWTLLKMLFAFLQACCPPVEEPRAVTALGLCAKYPRAIWFGPLKLTFRRTIANLDNFAERENIP